MYSLVFAENKQKNTAQGISKSTCQKSRMVISKKKSEKSVVNLIRCKNHKLYMDCIVKTGLCAFDDKRYVKINKVETFAYGHYEIKK
ncbi:hypothetical protein KUTeg_009302 [Tegillarca granosa]|uniref:Uncharacterized protein n=1 Tax=Tegillarca granosa TaxID=220873 RepID=A0ABQ9F6Y5_TEGGR|nr:hypothetical protein KUTeg_009302 [Tegillarca granosa]